jgi:hypothetical protein
MLFCVMIISAVHVPFSHGRLRLQTLDAAPGDMRTVRAHNHFGLRHACECVGAGAGTGRDDAVEAEEHKSDNEESLAKRRRFGTAAGGVAEPC